MTTMNDIFGIANFNDRLKEGDPDATVLSCDIVVTQRGNATWVADISFDSSDGKHDEAVKMYRGTTIGRVRTEVYRIRDKIVNGGTPKEKVTVQFVKK